MRPLKLLRTASFRLAAAYLVLFTVSVLILGAVVYSVVAHESRSTVDARLEEESERLRNEFARHGQAALVHTVDASGSETLGMRYLLQAAGGARLAGDLEIASDAAPPSAGFSDVEEGGSDEDETGGGPEHVRVLETRLDNGSILLVGQEWSRANEAPRAVLIAFFWALAATLALGVVGGLVLSRAFLRRIDAMRETAEGVMDGDWRRRVPLIPGGDVDILWGENEDKPEVLMTRQLLGTVREALKGLSLDSLVRIHPFSTNSHAKILIADDGQIGREIAIVGSCNWL